MMVHAFRRARPAATRRLPLLCYLALLSLLIQPVVVGHSRTINGQAERAAPGHPDTQRLRTRVTAHLATVPLGFEVNQGQTASVVRFLAHGPGYTLFLTATEAVMALVRTSPSHRPTPRAPLGVSDPLARTLPEGRATSVLRWRFVGANPNAIVTGGDALVGRMSYFLGNDPRRWRTNVHTYAQVRYHNLYAGIDLLQRDYSGPRNLDSEGGLKT